MQRRKIDSSGNGSAGGMSPTPYNQKKPPRTPAASRSSRGNPGRLLTILLLAAFIMALSTILFPNELRQVEDTTAQTTKEFVNNAYRVEQKVEDWIVQQQHPQFGGSNEKHEDATGAMQHQESSWVDGEKRLKEKLKILAERQNKGLDVGVPVLTRYLGEDFPAWADKDSEAEWQKKVDAKYAEMAKEEERWRESVRVAMERRARKVEEKAEADNTAHQPVAQPMSK